jgi:effector-binding domain-containing protein
VISEPRVEDRADQTYAAIRATVPMSGFGDLLGPMWDEVLGYLAQHGVEPAGAPFLRYDIIDMEGQLEIQVGVPIDAPLEGTDRIVVGTLPGGRYATLGYTGAYDGLVDANAALQAWADGKGLVFDQWSTDRGDAFAARLEIYRTDPAQEPDPSKWETEVAYRLADT